MTNKELAERIVDVSLEGLRIEINGVDYKPEHDKSLREELIPRILSILPEYQGEAVGKVTRYDLTTKDGYIFLTDLNKTEKKKISVGAMVYLSAPIKKENDNGR